jgi:citrate lyase subunit beta/citryl-CoA lyase
MTIRPRRSVLYMPGSNPRVLEKARALPADALIFDLEDAVAPEAKEEARRLVAQALKEGGYGPRERIVRINAPGTAWFDDDLAMALQASADAVLLPKVSVPEDVHRLAGPLREAGIDLWIMMETPLAVLNARDIAATARSTPLACLVMGTNDLARETMARLDEERLAFRPWLATCVAAARAFGLAIIDGVYNDFRDERGFRAECRQGRLMGFDGKTVIHPAQIEPANEIFAPTQEEVAWAEKIVEAFARPENAGRGAISLDGRMVELLHREIAERTLALARAIREREKAA